MAKRNSKKEWRSPLTIHSLAEYGGLDFEPPHSNFQAAGPWELTWQIWLLTPNRKESHHHGFLRIKKSNGRETNTFRLSVEQVLIEQHSLSRQTAEIRCQNNTFATPLKWSKRFEARFFSAQAGHEPIGFDKSGSLQGTVLSDGTRRTTVALPLSSNWSLLEALQRFSLKDNVSFPAFSLLDELEKVKENQRITFVAQRTISVGSQKVAVRCFQHIGQGALPWFYYIDLQGRLLVALSGMEALILNPHVQEIQRKTLKRLQVGGF